MSHTDYYFRHQCILRKLQKGPASLQEIQDYYELECETHGYAIIFSRRTFIRDKNEILSMFKREIGYNKSLNKYYLEEDDVPDDIGSRIADSFNTYLALNMMEGIADFVDLERRRPQGMEHFNDLMKSLKGNLVVTFEYEKFDDSEPSERRAEPLALKEFESRWYLLASDLKNASVKTFALDRMSNLHVTRQKFKKRKDFNISRYFEHCFGIIRPGEGETEPADILLSFKGNKGKYIKSLPLHASQKVTMETPDEMQVSLKLFITHDFIMELLKHGEELEVIQPRILRDKMGQTLKAAADKYNEKEVR